MASSDQSPSRDEDQALRCGICAAPITRRDQAIQVNGQHEHAFFNPAGHAFEIRCFRHAPGVQAQGEPSPEFTWFAGYQWQIVLCTRCRTHLGWRFIGGQSFYALITPRLS